MDKTNGWPYLTWDSTVVDCNHYAIENKLDKKKTLPNIPFWVPFGKSAPSMIFPQHCKVHLNETQHWEIIPRVVGRHQLTIYHFHLNSHPALMFLLGILCFWSKLILNRKTCISNFQASFVFLSLMGEYYKHVSGSGLI